MGLTLLLGVRRDTPDEVIEEFNRKKNALENYNCNMRRYTTLFSY